MIRISARKSELQGKNRSYKRKIGGYGRAGPRNANRIAQNRPSEPGFWTFYKKDLKAFLNPAKHLLLVSRSSGEALDVVYH